MVKSLVFCLLSVALWASGCNGVNSSPDVGTTDGHRASQPPPAPPEGEAEPLYLMLVGEIAGQRGQFDVALAHYLQLIRLVPDARIAERATQIALYVKDVDKAREAATVWAERDPGSLAAHRLKLVLDIKSGDTDAAVEEFGRLLELKDPELETTLIEMVKWLDAEMPQEQAMQVMQALSEAYPKVAELHFAYALLASNKNALMTARSETDQALALRPEWGRGLMLRAQLLMQAGDVKAARSALEKALKSDPGNARVGLLFAQFLAKSGDLKAAERQLKKIVDKDLGNHDARFALASVWMEMGQYDKARLEFQALSGDTRWQSQADFSLGLIEAREGHAEQALRQFDRVGPGPLEFDARYNSISALISLQRDEEARERLAKARQSFPNERVRLYLIEAEMLAKDKKLADAFEVLESGLKDRPGEADLLYARALLAERMGRLDVMEADLRAVLEHKPDDPAVLNALGFSLAEHRPDKLDEAEKYIKAALDKRPGDPAVMDSYGWVLYLKGQPSQALAYLKKAYGLFADPEISAHLGEVLWVLGRHDEARRIWAEGLKKDADQDDLLRVKEKYPDGFRGAAR